MAEKKLTFEQAMGRLEEIVAQLEAGDHSLEDALSLYEEGAKLMKQCAEEGWPIVMHDCCNMTKFARDLNVKVHEGGWFGASAYHSEFDGIPYAAFLPTLEDESFRFVEEEELPRGYRPGDIVL